MVVNGATPLCFELAVEGAFPVSTAFIIMFMTTAMNLCALALLFVPVSSDAAVFNWAYTAGCAAVTVALWVLYREQSKRYDFDSGSAAPVMEVGPQIAPDPRADPNHAGCTVQAP
jgi:hypothetical protein